MGDPDGHDAPERIDFRARTSPPAPLLQLFRLRLQSRKRGELFERFSARFRSSPLLRL